MLLRIRQRAVPAFCLVLSSLWLAAIYFPLFYSVVFPDPEIQHLIGALQGHEVPLQELSAYVQHVIDSSGHLRHPIRVAAYYGASVEYKHRQSHTARETEYAYLAWFEKRPKATIFVVNVSQTNGSGLRYDMREGEPLALARVLILPILAFLFSLYWFLRKRSIVREEQVPSPVVES